MNLGPLEMFVLVWWFPAGVAFAWALARRDAKRNTDSISEPRE